MRRTTGVLLAAALAAGCGGERRAAVAGRVTVGGRPLDTGSVLFYPADGRAASTGAEVIDGRYELPAGRGPTPGRNRVEVRGSMRTGRKVAALPPAAPGTMIDETVEAVPARYSRDSALVVEVSAAGGTHDFELDPK